MVFQRPCEEAECVPVRHWPGFEGLVDLHALIWNEEHSPACLELGDLHFLESNCQPQGRQSPPSTPCCALKCTGLTYFKMIKTSWTPNTTQPRVSRWEAMEMFRLISTISGLSLCHLIIFVIASCALLKPNSRWFQWLRSAFCFNGNSGIWN